MPPSAALSARSVPAFGQPAATAIRDTMSAFVIYIPNAPRASSITVSSMVA